MCNDLRELGSTMTKTCDTIEKLIPRVWKRIVIGLSGKENEAKYAETLMNLMNLMEQHSFLKDGI